jgi:hypothetical protein
VTRALARETSQGAGRATDSKPGRTARLICLLGIRRSVESVRARLQLALAALVAVAILGGLVPHSVPSEAAAMVRPAVAVLEEPLSTPVSCADAVCGKGSPVPSAPSPAGPLVAVVGASLVTALAVMALRHRRTHPAPLPAGVRDGLFRPPRSS